MKAEESFSPHILDATSEAVLPIRDADAVGLLELRLVEHAIVRTLGRRGIF